MLFSLVPFLSSPVTDHLCKTSSGSLAPTPSLDSPVDPGSCPDACTAARAAGGNNAAADQARRLRAQIRIRRCKSHRTSAGRTHTHAILLRCDFERACTLALFVLKHGETQRSSRHPAVLDAADHGSTKTGACHRDCRGTVAAAILGASLSPCVMCVRLLGSSH